jgi:hypothetical protein
LATVVAGRDLVTFDLTSLDREYALALAIGRGGLRLPVPAISKRLPPSKRGVLEQLLSVRWAHARQCFGHQRSFPANPQVGVAGASQRRSDRPDVSLVYG